jgi:hypothetical protein
VRTGSWTQRSVYCDAIRLNANAMWARPFGDVGDAKEEEDGLRPERRLQCAESRVGDPLRVQVAGSARTSLFPQTGFLSAIAKTLPSFSAACYIFTLPIGHRGSLPAQRTLSSICAGGHKRLAHLFLASITTRTRRDSSLASLSMLSLAVGFIDDAAMREYVVGLLAHAHGTEGKSNRPLLHVINSRWYVCVVF